MSEANFRPSKEQSNKFNIDLGPKADEFRKMLDEAEESGERDPKILEARVNELRQKLDRVKDKILKEDPDTDLLDYLTTNKKLFAPHVYEDVWNKFLATVDRGESEKKIEDTKTEIKKDFEVVPLSDTGNKYGDIEKVYGGYKIPEKATDFINIEDRVVTLGLELAGESTINEFSKYIYSLLNDKKRLDKLTNQIINEEKSRKTGDIKLENMRKKRLLALVKDEFMRR